MMILDDIPSGLARDPPELEDVPGDFGGEARVAEDLERGVTGNVPRLQGGYEA